MYELLRQDPLLTLIWIIGIISIFIGFGWPTIDYFYSRKKKAGPHVVHIEVKEAH